MTISLKEFLMDLSAEPMLMVISALIIGVIIVNGGVDTVSTISTCISTCAINPKAAVIMAAIFNFLGVVLMTAISMKVAQTVYHLVDFQGTYRQGMIGLSATLIAVVLWTLLAGKYKIPTSESHALIAGITGSAIAISGNFTCIHLDQWMKVLYGVGISLLGAFVLGWASIKMIGKLLKDMDRRKTFQLFKNAQIGSAATISFMHGAQDGQKFIGVFIIAIFLAEDQVIPEAFYIPLWLMILCGTCMAIGTIFGGNRLKRCAGLLSIKVEKYQGFSIDFSTTLCLLGASLSGIPMSTKHTKISALLGVEGAKGFYSLDTRLLREMLLSLAWVFPACGVIAYGVTVFLLKIL